MGLTQKLALAGVFVILSMIFAGHEEDELMRSRWRGNDAYHRYHALKIFCIGGVIGMLLSVAFPW